MARQKKREVVSPNLRLDPGKDRTTHCRDLSAVTRVIVAACQVVRLVRSEEAKSVIELQREESRRAIGRQDLRKGIGSVRSDGMVGKGEEGEDRIPGDESRSEGHRKIVIGSDGEPARPKVEKSALGDGRNREMGLLTCLDLLPLERSEEEGLPLADWQANRRPSLQTLKRVLSRRWIGLNDGDRRRQAVGTNHHGHRSRIDRNPVLKPVDDRRGQRIA